MKKSGIVDKNIAVDQFNEKQKSMRSLEKAINRSKTMGVSITPSGSETYKTGLYIVKQGICAVVNRPDAKVDPKQ